MKEVSISAWCDECDDKGERIAATETVLIALDQRPVLSLDLCDPHAKAVRSIGDLLDSHGAAPEAKSPRPVTRRGRPPGANAKHTIYACPECSIPLTSRMGVLNHLGSIHGIDKITASQRVLPTSGNTEQCKCGFVANTGPGMSAHQRADHADGHLPVKPYKAPKVA
jgi:hypothetical protein